MIEGGVGSLTSVATGSGFRFGDRTESGRFAGCDDFRYAKPVLPTRGDVRNRDLVDRWIRVTDSTVRVELIGACDGEEGGEATGRSGFAVSGSGGGGGGGTGRSLSASVASEAVTPSLVSRMSAGLCSSGRAGSGAVGAAGSGGSGWQFRLAVGAISTGGLGGSGGGTGLAAAGSGGSGSGSGLDLSCSDICTVHNHTRTQHDSLRRYREAERRVSK